MHRLLFLSIGDKLKESHITCEKCLVNLLGKAKQGCTWGENKRLAQTRLGMHIPQG